MRSMQKKAVQGSGLRHLGSRFLFFHAATERAEGRRVRKDRLFRDTFTFLQNLTSLYSPFSLSLFAFLSLHSADCLRAPPERQPPRLDPPAPLRLQDVDRRESFFIFLFSTKSKKKKTSFLLTLTFPFFFLLTRTRPLLQNPHAPPLSKPARAPLSIGPTFRLRLPRPARAPAHRDDRHHPHLDGRREKIRRRSERFLFFIVFFFFRSSLAFLLRKTTPLLTFPFPLPAKT